LSDEPVICSVCGQVAAHPELRGKMFRKKDGTAIPMSFSAALVQIAGGIDRLLADWEEDV
jgi:hypothetical protein